MKNVKVPSRIFLIAAIACICGLPFAIRSQNRSAGSGDRNFDDVILRNAREFMEQGQKTFRFDTFGDEAFWGDALKLHQAIAGSKLGGVGPGVSPRTALAVGLKVDSEALPPNVVEAIRNEKANRAPDKRYRTAPLKGLWSHQKGGFYHDGRFATLRDVVDHYDRYFNIGLTEAEKSDLINYLLSL